MCFPEREFLPDRKCLEDAEKVFWTEELFRIENVLSIEKFFWTEEFFLAENVLGTEKIFLDRGTGPVRKCLEDRKNLL
jgi:hypothetical protein